MVQHTRSSGEHGSNSEAVGLVRTGFFKSTDATPLFYEAQAPDERPRACVVILHGYADHAGRYRVLGSQLVAEGFTVFAFDYRGHGRSAGRRGYCRSFNDFLCDLECALAMAATIADDSPLVLLAQSHGALIALRWLCEQDRAGSVVDAAVLSSPYLGPTFRLTWLESLALAVSSRFVPGLTFGNRLRAAQLTHDAEMVAAHERDPLVHHVATARWLTESRLVQQQVVSCVGRLAVPTLWLIGQADPIADPSVGLQTYEKAGGEKDLKLYDGFYHEPFNEVGRERVVSDVMSWLAARYPLPSPDPSVPDTGL